MAAAAQFRVEHVAPAPRGWRTRTIVPGPRSQHEGRAVSAHRIRVAFPPGRRRKGSGKVVEILHPKDEKKNPTCKVTEQAKKNPGELLVFGNPSKLERKRATRERAAQIRRARLNSGTKNHKADCGCFACKHKRGENPKRATPRRRRKDRRNPSEEQTAVQLYKSFHGKDPKEIVEKHVSAATRLEYAALGDLEYVKVVTPLGQTATFDFEGDGVKLASSPDGKQLYAIGGNQNLASCIDKDSLEKDFLDLGEAQEVQYLARKVHGDFHPVSYFHKFGEKNGAKPQLMFDKLKKQIFFIGGEYFIDTTKGVSPGIEN
jgi:hypothetical protein